MKNSKFRLNNLQIVRALAALNVVVFHAIGNSNSHGNPPNILSFLAGWGMSGVDVFFVLSGFIMTYSQWGEGITPKKFILARIIRIVPAYWVVTTIVITLLMLAPSVFREATLSYSRALASFFFMAQPLLGEFPYVAVGWTLEFEALFYILFACSLFTQSRIFSLSFIFISLMAIIYLFEINTIAVEFLWGVLIGISFKNFPINKLASQVALFVGLIVFLSTIFIDYHTPRFIIWGLPAALIIIGSVGVRQTTWKFGIFLGDASYSIYLIHLLTIPAFFKALELFDITSINNDMLVIMCVFVSTLSGVVFYLLVEKPLLLKVGELVRVKKLL